MDAWVIWMQLTIRTALPSGSRTDVAALGEVPLPEHHCANTNANRNYWISGRGRISGEVMHLTWLNIVALDSQAPDHCDVPN